MKGQLRRVRHCLVCIILRKVRSTRNMPVMRGSYKR